MGKSNVKIISIDRYNGTASARELFAEIVRRIFSLSLSGYSAKKIAEI